MTIQLAGVSHRDWILPNSHRANNPLSFAATILLAKQWVNTGSPLSVEITFQPSYEGRHLAFVELVFHDLIRKQVFTIVRNLQALVGSKDDHERLRPSAPYVGPSPPQAAPAPENIHPGRRPVTWSKTKWSKRLPEFLPPKDLIDVAFGPGKDIVRRIKEEFMPQTFDISTYGHYFEVLLHIEEEQTR